MKKFGKTKISNEPKINRKIKVRNRVAQAMREEFRKFGERKIPNKKKGNRTKFNKQKFMKDLHYDDCDEEIND